MDDAFESMEDQEELEEEADAEVEKVLWELTAGLYQLEIILSVFSSLIVIHRCPYLQMRVALYCTINDHDDDDDVPLIRSQHVALYKCVLID